MAEQVLTTGIDAEPGNWISGQALAIVADLKARAGLHYDVIHGDVAVKPATENECTREDAAGPPHSQRRPSTTKHSKRDRRRKKKYRKAGGWPVTSYIDHDTFERCRADAGILAHAGFPFTIMVTVRPPASGASDAKAKRYIEVRLAHLGQALERRGHAYIGMKAYEKIGGWLHAHMLLHVTREGLPAVVRWADRFDERRKERYEIVEGVEKHARRADADALDYALKQRRWIGPYEGGKGRKFYQKGEAFRGRRVVFTPAAQALIQQAVEAEQQQAPPVVVEVIKPKPSQFALVQGGQIELFAEKPVARLKDYGGGLMPAAVAREIRFHLKQLAMTQDDLAHAAHLGRPTITNALEGRFPLSEWAAWRIRETLLQPSRWAA